MCMISMKFTRGRFQVLHRCEVFFDVSWCVYAILQGKLMCYLFELAKSDIHRRFVTKLEVKKSPEELEVKKKSR